MKGGEIMAYKESIAAEIRELFKMLLKDIRNILFLNSINKTLQIQLTSLQIPTQKEFSKQKLTIATKLQ